MLTIKNSQFINSQVYTIDFLIDTDSYNNLKDRITEQYLKNIEVPGFRKGKAPREKLMAKADMPYLENLIWNETINRNYPEANKILDEKVESEKRSTLSVGIDPEIENIGLDENGFKFRLVANLLPDIDLSKVSEIIVKNPTKDDLIDRPTLEQVIEKEKNNFLKTFNQFEDCELVLSDSLRAIADIDETNITEGLPLKENKNMYIQIGISQFPPEFEEHVIGMKAGETKEFALKLKNQVKNESQEFAFRVTIKSVQSPKYATFAELFANSKDISTAFESEEKFEENIKSSYNQETNSLVETLKSKMAMTAIAKSIGKIDLDDEDIKSEVNRIQSEFLKGGNSVTSFNQSQFPHVKVATKDSLLKEITNYVEGEFKMAKICLAIYVTKVTEKSTEEELNKFQKEISQDPEKYGYPKGLTEQALKDRIFDNVLRNKAINWILNTIKFN